jgi:hypothetical protein
VFQQCGGHPFLAQYMMHYAWDSLHKGTAPAASNIVSRFRSERHSDLDSWRTDVGQAGLVAYKVLVEAGTWLTEMDVKQSIQDEQIVPKIGQALYNLCYHGLVLHDGTWSRYRVAGQLVKDWFVDEVFPLLKTLTSLLSTHSPPITFLDRKPNIKSELLPTFPTAYWHTMTRERFPLVTLVIDNTCLYCTNTSISIEVTILGYSHPATDTLDVPSGSSERRSLLPRLIREKVLNLTEVDTASCRILVKRHTENGLITIYDETPDIEMQAIDTVLFAVQSEQGSIVEDLADYLAVFVTSKRQEVKDFVGVASHLHLEKAFIGYHADEGSYAGNIYQMRREISQAQAKAFFYALRKQVELHYIFSPINSGKRPDQITQRVRFPFHVLPKEQGQVGQFSCLDGAILFASLLEHIGIEPLIVLVKDHAFVGWRIWRDAPQADFLETTMIPTKSNFETALAAGNRLYQEAIEQGFNKRSLFDPNGFIRIIDIAACRKRGIHPFT